MSDQNAHHVGRHRQAGRDEPKGIGFGVFLVLAGAALLAEKLGWVPHAFDWLFPVILIAWGSSELFQRLKSS